MSVPTCFEDVIGFSRSQDTCVTGWDASYAVSKSGLYIDELLYSLRILDSLEGKDGIWEMMERARMNGTEKFMNDIMPELLKYNEYRREKFVGEIGERRFHNLITKDTYHGMRLFSDIRGGKFTLRGVTLNLSTTENVNLLVYDDFELLDTFAVSSEAGKPKYTAVTPTEYSLQGNLYFIYAPAGTPYNNKITCGCGGYHWCFRPEKPCYNSSRENWTLWAMAGGIHGTDPTLRDDWSVSDLAQGIRLHGDFKCDFEFCSDASDFENNNVDKSIAWAILYATTEFLIYEFQKSLEVSREKLLGDDLSINTGLQYCADRYAKQIEFISAYLPISGNDCLRCRPVMGMSRTSQRL